MAWDTFFDAGGVAGMVALAAQGVRFARDYRRRPRLQIEPIDPARDLQQWMVTNLQRTQRVFTLQISNTGKRTAMRCVATLTITRTPTNLRQSRFVLHWADLPYSHHSSTAPAVDIGSEGRRLDVAFTIDGQRHSGCWVAIPMALAAPIPNQALLQPGEYEATVAITSDTADPVSVRIRLIAPTVWADLKAGTLLE